MRTKRQNKVLALERRVIFLRLIFFCLVVHCASEGLTRSWTPHGRDGQAPTACATQGFLLLSTRGA